MQPHAQGNEIHLDSNKTTAAHSRILPHTHARTSRLKTELYRVAQKSCPLRLNIAGAGCIKGV